MYIKYTNAGDIYKYDVKVYSVYLKLTLISVRSPFSFRMNGLRRENELQSSWYRPV